MFPASDANAPFGIRIVNDGVCSNESGMDRRSTFMAVSSPGGPVENTIGQRRRDANYRSRRVNVKTGTNGDSYRTTTPRRRQATPIRTSSYKNRQDGSDVASPLRCPSGCPYVLPRVLTRVFHSSS